MILGILITIIVMIGLLWYSMYKLCKEDETNYNGCKHPIRRREGYREGVYKCWECGKIIFEN
jgi:hypothetical protein